MGALVGGGRVSVATRFVSGFSFNGHDFRNALGTQYVCDAVLESAETGQWVDVKRA